MRNKLSIADLDLKGKKALVRVDFNVPLDKQGQITDDTRITASLPTIRYILDRGGAVILMSHLGRPKDRVAPEYSLSPCAVRLAELLQHPVRMASDCIGPGAVKLAHSLQPGEILLLENLRFHRGEEHPNEDPAFAEKLASLGDVYINDAFGTAHREHSSTSAIAKYFPGRAAAGFLMQNEISHLGSLLLHPQRPFYAILGGAKVSTKFGVIEALMKKADALLIGGAMAYTFLKAKGITVGASLYEEEFVPAAQDILKEATHSSCKLFLPSDVVIVKEIKPQADSRVVTVEKGIPEGWHGVDIGPDTVSHYTKILDEAATVFWNGPLGVFECPPFDQGTVEIAKMLARSPATKVIGGGDSLAAIEKAGVADRMNHLSTGGGACLEYIEFGQLPGIESLSDKSDVDSSL